MKNDIIGKYAHDLKVEVDISRLSYKQPRVPTLQHDFGFMRSGLASVGIFPTISMEWRVDMGDMSIPKMRCQKCGLWLEQTDFSPCRGSRHTEAQGYDDGY